MKQVEVQVQKPDIREGTTSQKPAYDCSSITTHDELVLLQQAGKAVGLRVIQVQKVLSSSGTVVPMEEGMVGVRYMTGDVNLFDAFNAKVTELKAAQNATSPQR